MFFAIEEGEETISHNNYF